MGASKSKRPTVAESLTNIGVSQFRIKIRRQMAERDLKSKRQKLEIARSSSPDTTQLAHEVTLYANNVAALQRQEMSLAALSMRIEHMQHNNSVAELVGDLAFGLSNEVQNLMAASPEKVLVMMQSFEAQLSQVELGHGILEDGLDQTQEKMAPKAEVDVLLEEHKERESIEEEMAIGTLPVASRSLSPVGVVSDRAGDAKSPGGRGGGAKVADAPAGARRLVLCEAVLHAATAEPDDDELEARLRRLMG